ncbi:MAG: N-acetylmuramoyl-L-alanine amidase-like domain-containing protein [Phormidium sp.]
MSKFFKVVVLGAIASSLSLVVCQPAANHSFSADYTPLEPQFLVGVTADEIINLARQNQKVVNTEELRFQKLMRYAQEQNLYNLSMSEIMQTIAEYFLGAEYKANLLDKSNPETLVVTLDKFDCVLFVETVLAIARGIAVKDYSYQTFVDRLQNQRYRNGELPEYCRRLHYFSDWIIDNQNRGNVQNISVELGGISQNKTLNFMSKNRNRYPLMINNDANYQCIVQMESQLAELTVNYIPKHRISRVYSQLQPGDIIAVATNISGLDFTHTGLVYRHTNGRVGFIHASPAGTVTTARDLQRYVRNVKNSIGIVVVRAIDPRHLQR